MSKEWSGTAFEKHPMTCGVCRKEVVNTALCSSCASKFNYPSEPGLRVAVRELLSELTCECGPEWTGRNLHAPDCVLWIHDRLLSALGEGVNNEDATLFLPVDSDSTADG